MSVPVSTDPCKDSENSLNTMCRVEAITRQPLLFALPESCPPGNEPLCASDGQTYPSDCAMTATGAQKGVKLRKIHAGQCRRQGEGGENETSWQKHMKLSASRCLIHKHSHDFFPKV